MAGGGPNLGAASQLDILERVLDKGIVIDAIASIGVLGINHIVDLDARVVVASIDTYVRYAQPLSCPPLHVQRKSRSIGRKTVRPKPLPQLRRDPHLGNEG
jgi:hypothetical protein